MAKSLDQVELEKKTAESEGQQVGGDDDVELAFRMGVQALDEGGMDVIRDAINQSQDPAMVIGQFLGQMIGMMAEQLQEEMGVDPRIFLAQGGWLELMLDYIEKELGYPEEFSDQVYAEVLELIKAAASGPEAPNNVMGGEEEGNLPAMASMAPQPSQPSLPQAGGMV